MDLIQLEIIGISYSQTQTGAYARILSEIIGKRKLPIVIGGFEAQSIAMGIENEIAPPRPLTHDLFNNVLNKFNASKDQLPKIKNGLFDTYKEIVPALIKQKIEPNYHLEISLPDQQVS